MVRIGSLGVSRDLQLLAQSGCHSNEDGQPSAAGHEYCPLFDEQLTDEVQQRLYDIDGPADTLQETFWSFSPRCKECVKVARAWMVGERGLEPSHWTRLMDLFKVRESAGWANASESEQHARRWGWNKDGEYRLIDEVNLSTTVAEHPDAVAGTVRCQDIEARRLYRATA